jgi:hypothetical protein
MSEHARNDVYVSSACWWPRWMQLNLVDLGSVPLAYMAGYSTPHSDRAAPTLKPRAISVNVEPTALTAITAPNAVGTPSGVEAMPRRPSLEQMAYSVAHAAIDEAMVLTRIDVAIVLGEVVESASGLSTSSLGFWPPAASVTTLSPTPGERNGSRWHQRWLGSWILLQQARLTLPLTKRLFVGR